MPRGLVNVDTLNLAQGETKEIERRFLFIGVGSKAENIGQVLSLNNSSDLDTLLGEPDSPLKRNLEAARDNAGQNWFAWALPISATATHAEVVELFENVQSTYFKATSAEAVVMTRPATSASEFEDCHAVIKRLLGSHGRQMFGLIAAPGVDPATQDWSQYEAAMQGLVASVAANRVVPVPMLHGNDIGVLAGRLCNRTVGIADTPMRVATEAVLSLGDTPVDKEGVSLPESTLEVLSNSRYSVPQHYPDFAGTYWADASTLEAEGGDYQYLEHLRPVLKACRAVRILAIQKIGDKNFNDTAESIAFHKTYFARPLRAMSKSTTIDLSGQKYTIVGDIKPPTDKSVVIEWVSLKKVNIILTVKPYNCPKEITASIALDLSGEV